MNVLVIHNHIPKPDLNGAELRLIQFLGELRPVCDSIIFAALWPCQDGKYMNALAELKITAYAGAQDLALYGIRPPYAWSLSDIFAQNHIDIVVLTLWFWDYLSMPEHYVATIRQLSPRSIVAVLTDDPWPPPTAGGSGLRFSYGGGIGQGLFGTGGGGLSSE